MKIENKSMIRPGLLNTIENTTPKKNISSYEIEKLKAYLCFARHGETKQIIFAFDEKDCTSFAWRHHEVIKKEANNAKLNIKCKRLSNFDHLAEGNEPYFYNEQLDNN